MLKYYQQYNPSVPIFNELSPSEEQSIDVMQEKTDDVTQEKQTESVDSSYATSKLSTHQQFNQLELNDLVLDLGLSKNTAEILASTLPEVSYFQNQEQVFVERLKRRKSLFIVKISQVFSMN